MNNFVCVLSTWCLILHFGENVEARSINIDISHVYKFAVDEYRPQESVNLDNVEKDVRQQLEDGLKSFQKATNDINSLLPSVNESKNLSTSPAPVSLQPSKQASSSMPTAKPSSLPLAKRNKTSPILELLFASTSPDPHYADTPSPEVRPKRNAQLAMLANKNINNSPMHLQYGQGGEMTDFEMISEEDLLRAKRKRMKGILTYIGITLIAVVGFSIIAFCFLSDPKSCIIAFGTGSPCCLIICPCILHCVKRFLTPGAMIRDNTNKFIPGMLIHPDGRLETYEPTQEEIDAIMDIMEIIQDMA